MSYEEENREKIEKIRQFLINVVDENDEKNEIINRIYKLIRSSRDTVYELKRKMALQGAYDDYAEEKSEDLETCVDFLKEAIVDGIMNEMIHSGYLDVERFNALYNIETNRNFIVEVFSENTDDIKKGIMDMLIKKYSNEKERYISLNEFAETYYQLTGKDLREQLISEHRDELKESIKARLREYVVYRKSEKEILSINHFQFINRNIGEGDFIEQLLKNRKKDIASLIFESIENYICKENSNATLKEIDFTNLKDCLGLSRENLNKILNSDNTTYYSPIVKNRLAERIQYVVNKEVNNKFYNFDKIIVDSQLDNDLNSSLEICAINMIGNGMKDRISIMMAPYLEQYFRECVNVIVQNNLSEYYVTIPKKEYLNRYFNECADRILKEGYSKEYDVVRKQINKLIDKTMLLRILFKIDCYFGIIIEKTRAQVLRGEIEQQGITLE